MGKKATNYLIHVILIVVTFILFFLSVIARFASMISPDTSWVVTMIGLWMLPILIINSGLLIYWIIRHKVWSVIPALALIINIGFIASILQISNNPKDVTPDIKIASYNIHGFSHTDFKITAENISYFMQEQGVDVLCLQEFVVNGKYDVESLKNMFSQFPYLAFGNHKNKIANQIIFSKYPIVQSATISYTDTDNGSIWADIDVNGNIVRVFNNHFQTTNISQSQKEIAQIGSSDVSTEVSRQAYDVVTGRLRRNVIKRAQQSEVINSLIKKSPYPVIVCGDFNDTPSSYVYATTKGSLSDGFRTNGNGYEYTYQGFLNMLRIDYVLFDCHKLKGIKYYTPEIEWSDHYPVIMELVFIK